MKVRQLQGPNGFCRAALVSGAPKRSGTLFRRLPAVLAFLVMVAFGALPGSSASADQNNPQLDTLFEQLKQAQSLQTAQALSNRIWTLWIRSEKDSINILMRQGVRAMQSGDFATAYDYFTTMTDLEPDFAEAWNKRATVLFLIGDLDGSIKDVERTLALEPRHFGALTGLGMINDALEDEEAALEAYEAALDLHPYLPEAVVRVEQLRKILEGRRI